MKGTAKNKRGGIFALLGKVTGFFTKDPFLKLGALLISVLVWLIVMNVTDPIEKRTYMVNLSLVNVPALAGEKKILMNQDGLEGTIVSVTLEGPRSAFDSNARSKVSAYIDFRLAEIINAKQVGEPIMTSIVPDIAPDLANKGIVVSAYSPRTVDVILDNETTLSKVIQKTTSGEVADGYVSKPMKISQENVKITGPQLLIAKIACVKAEYDLTGLNASVSEEVPIRAYGYDNEEIKDGFALSESFVTVEIEINKTEMISIESPATTGAASEGYRITGIDYEPKIVELLGKKEELDALGSIVMDPIDVSEISETREYRFDIRSKFINTGLSERYSENAIVVITVTVEKLIEREFVKPVGEINLSGISNNVEIVTDSVSVTVKGVESVIDALTDAHISAKVALNDLEPGEHEIPVTFSVPYRTGPSVIEIVSEPAFITVIVREPSEDAPPGEDGEPGESEEPGDSPEEPFEQGENANP